MRLREARRDYYRRRAKAAGFRSRAAFKLLQLNQKFRFFEPGKLVVDLGCAPGGWLQVASQEVGPSGRVVGIDLVPVDFKASNVDTIVADINDSHVEGMLLQRLAKKADIVLSDLSPHVSGIWDLDHAKQIELSRRVLQLLPAILAKGGWTVLKIFQGEQLPAFLQETKVRFMKLSIEKPPASRGKSSEIYLVCRNFVG